MKTALSVLTRFMYRDEGQSLILHAGLHRITGMQVLEWNGVPLTGKTYEEVQSIMGQTCAEAELCVRL